MGRQGLRALVANRRRSQRPAFIGREAQLAWFRDNLEAGGPGERRRAVINISGAGGVGKTWLLRQFREMAEEAGAIAAGSDEADVCVGEVMCRLAEQFAAQNQPLEHFAAGYSLYCQRRHEIEAEPQAARSGPPSASPRPAGGAVDDLEGQVASAAQSWDFPGYLAQRLRQRTGQRPLLRPMDVLTPLLLKDLGHLAQGRLVLLFFDDYEHTGTFLDGWLRELLEGRHGEMPSNLLLVIAGEYEVDREAWAPYESSIARFPLQPFTGEEAREYLALKGVVDELAVDVILHLSDRLPLLLATLAASEPPRLTRTNQQDVASLVEPGSGVVDCFLRWLPDPDRRQLARDAALPRRLDREVVALLAGQEQVDDLLAWLQSLPFMNRRGGAWVYHELVRGQMLHARQREHPEDWGEVHGRLAAFYEGLRNGLGRGDGTGTVDPVRENGRRQAYALEALYHRLCQAPQAELPTALNGFLAALQAELTFARRWAQVLERAGEDTGANGLRQWGQQLAAGLSAQEEEQYLEAVDLFSALLEEADLEAGWRASALDWRGALHVLAGEYADATRDLSDAIRLAPETAETWLLRGEAHRRLGQDRQAVADLSRALELEPDDDWALALRGATARRLGRDEDALADLSRALELQPDDTWALALRGETLWQMEHYPEALADLDRALELEADSLPALASRADTYRLLGRYPETLADLDRLLELAPDHPWALARRGETHRQMGDLRQAVADLDRALELDPDDDFALASRGEANRQLERYAEALADFGRALELDPGSAWVLARRGWTYRRLGRYPEALADLNRALELQPGDRWLLANRGVACLRLARYAEALTDLDQVVRQAPDRASLLATHGEACRLARRSRAALADLEQALALAPDHAPALRSRGQLYRQLGRYPEALADLNRALKLQPHNAFALRGRGETYRRLGRYEEALADFDRALELDPGSAWALARRGQTCAQMERYAEALADLNRALELQPGNIWCLYHRARTHQALGHMDEARADLAAVVEHARQAAEDRPEAWQHPFQRVVFRLGHVAGSET